MEVVATILSLGVRWNIVKNKSSPILDCRIIPDPGVGSLFWGVVYSWEVVVIYLYTFAQLVCPCCPSLVFSGGLAITEHVRRVPVHSPLRRVLNRLLTQPYSQSTSHGIQHIWDLVTKPKSILRVAGSCASVLQVMAERRERRGLTRNAVA